MEHSKLPTFTGDSAQIRLNQALSWVTHHCPGRQLTLDEVGTIMDEVGTIMGVTRERVRQIEAKALKKLRHPLRMRELRNAL